MGQIPLTHVMYRGSRDVMKYTFLFVCCACLVFCESYADNKNHKLVVITQQENSYYPPPVNGYPSAVFEINPSNGSIRLAWNGTLDYGANICAFATPATDNHLLYVLKDSGTLLTIDMKTGQTLRTQAVSSADPPRWFNSLDYDSASKSLYAICNASYGWPMGRQWCRISLNASKTKAPLQYIHTLPGWGYSINEADDCVFNAAFSAGLFWYMTQDHIVRGLNIDNATLDRIGFANPQSLNFDIAHNKLFDLKKLDDVFQPLIVSQVKLVTPNTTTPPDPPEETVTELPKNLTLVSIGMSAIDNEGSTIFALMTDKPNQWNRPIIPDSLVSVDMSTKKTTVYKLDFSPYRFLDSQWRFSRLFFT
ncbi:uncharacterized protein LOC134176366 [Corticium candelabrum]|uniref:uncharacterized protein LOC134176366 n=1 Tax=Corticium candelabrum TaxID=121492 RepID=UPI002E268E73|nr:uncharacterized protein LOC134176366 [Corticium candelabrum]